MEVSDRRLHRGVSLDARVASAIAIVGLFIAPAGLVLATNSWWPPTQVDHIRMTVGSLIAAVLVMATVTYLAFRAPVSPTRSVAFLVSVFLAIVGVLAFSGTAASSSRLIHLLT